MKAVAWLLVACCAPLLAASAQDDPQWRSLDVSRQLRDSAPQRITVMSWGKERPGSMRIGTSMVAVGPRVVTTIR